MTENFPILCWKILYCQYLIWNFTIGSTSHNSLNIFTITFYNFHFFQTWTCIVWYRNIFIISSLKLLVKLSKNIQWKSIQFHRVNFTSENADFWIVRELMGEGMEKASAKPSYFNPLVFFFDPFNSNTHTH